MLMPPIKFYNDTITLRFNTEEHIYYLEHPNGELEPQDGVTTVCGIMDKSRFLMPWACRVMADQILREMPHTKDFTGDYIHAMDWTEFESLVVNAKRAHKEHLSTAADIGGAAHVWIDETVQWAIDNNGGIVKEMSERRPDDPHSVKCGEAAFDWMKTRRVKFLKTEHKVYSKQYGYAGTMDGLAEVDGILSVFDWKTSNQLRDEYFLQTAAYLCAHMEEFPKDDIKDRWILRLGKENGKFYPWHVGPETIKDDFDTFLLCLNLSRSMEKLKNRVSADKKIKKKAKK